MSHPNLQALEIDPLGNPAAGRSVSQRVEPIFRLQDRLAFVIGAGPPLPVHLLRAQPCPFLEWKEHAAKHVVMKLRCSQTARKARSCRAVGLRSFHRLSSETTSGGIGTVLRAAGLFGKPMQAKPSERWQTVIRPAARSISRQRSPRNSLVRRSSEIAVRISSTVSCSSAAAITLASSTAPSRARISAKARGWLMQGDASASLRRWRRWRSAANAAASRISIKSAFIRFPSPCRKEYSQLSDRNCRMPN